MKKYVKSIIAILLLGMTLIAFSYGFKTDDAQVDDSQVNVDTSSEQVIEFETTPGFYTKNAKVVIKKNRDCEVYYTTDGNVPGETIAPEECKVYNDGGILLRGPKTGMVVNSITARACWKVEGSDELTWSEPIINTYVVGGIVEERFQNTTVFITCDPEKLFGYESGILVPGKLRDDWIRENPGETVIAISPAGYMLRGWESERVVNVEFFTPDGQQVINQTVGARPSGAYSRASKLKSIKLFARSDYETIDNKFVYQLFGDQYAWDGSGRIITDYKRILLRSGGSDVKASQMRDEVHQMLAYDAGIIGAQKCEPVSVFINGQYYGSMWAHEVISDKWFEDHFGTYPGFMAVASGPERSKPDTRYEIDSIEEDQFFYDDWNALYEKYGASDMTDDAVYEEFCSVLDVENYLFYYAINVYINNNDWPNNNHKCYRYYAAEGEEYQEGTVFDGRWRFLPHDMDWIWGPQQDVLNTNLVSTSTRSKIFKALMKRDECVDMFIGYLMELVNGAFSTENYLGKINSMHEARLNELEYYTRESKFKVSSLATMLEAVDKNRTYAIERPKTLITDLRKAFKISGDTYDVHITAPENCYITTGNWEIDEEFNGNYVVEHGATYVCHPFVGYEFSHWTVNGDVIRSNELYISEYYIAQKAVEVKAHVVPKTATGLMIVEYSSEGNDDYLVLYNPSVTEAISTYGYSLSDSENKLGKYMLPAKIVEPQAKVKIYCDNYSGAEKYHQMAVPFNLKEGEVLYLSETGEIIEKITLMHLNDGYSAVRSMKDNKFYETKIDK